MRERSNLARRRIAALLLAAAASGGCNMIRNHIPGLARSSEVASDPMRMRDGADRKHLEQQRTELRARRERAWESLRGGHGTSGYGTREALALSIVEEALDADAAWPQRPAAGRAMLADLPRRHWWYLFVDPIAWAGGPLVIDRHGAPGFYAAMMNAFDRALAAPAADAPALDAAGYLALHQLVTLGVFHQHGGVPEPQGFTDGAVGFAIAPLHDPGHVRVDALAKSLAELKDEGLATWNADIQRARGSDELPPWFAAIADKVSDINPHSKPAHLIYERGHDAHGFAQWLRAWNDYEPDEARKWVAQWLAAFTDEQGQIAGRLTGAAYFDALATAEPSDAAIATLRPVCRLIRRLEVSHVFVAGGTRLDTRVLLTKLLLAQGLPPAIVDDPRIFGGRAPLDAIVREVFRGQRRFQELVTELAGREPPPPPAPAPAEPNVPVLAAPGAPAAPMIAPAPVPTATR